MAEFRRSSDYWRLFHELYAKIVSKYPSAFYRIEENINEPIIEQMALVRDHIQLDLMDYYFDTN